MLRGCVCGGSMTPKEISREGVCLATYEQCAECGIVHVLTCSKDRPDIVQKAAARNLKIIRSWATPINQEEESNGAN